MSGGPWRILVVVDHKENRRKCSLTPIEGLPGVDFVRLSARSGEQRPFELPPGILLAVDAPPLEAGDRHLLEAGALILIDATWARLPAVGRRLAPRPGARIERRSLPAAARTAYPRVSKVHRDPDGGLASIEALYLATAILGEPRPALLEGFHWREEFLALNGLSAS